MTRSLSMRFHGRKKPTDEKPPGGAGCGATDVASGAGQAARPPRKLDANNWLKKASSSSSGLEKEKPPSNMKTFNSVGDKMSLWANKVQKHEEKQATNPFSEHFDKSRVQVLDKNDPNYGR